MTKTVTKPTIKRRDMDAVLNCLVDEALGPGEYSEALVRQLADELGCSGGLAFREYGRALEVTFEALAPAPGSKVLLSALAPAIYLEALARKQLEAVICDVDPRTGSLSQPMLAAAASDGIQAVVLDAPLGITPDADGFADAPIPIVEDISWSLGSTRGELSSGRIGRYVVMRLEEDGVITSGGGALVLARHKRAQGELNGSADRFGMLAILGNLNAALATVQFRHLGEFTERRRNIARIYAKSLERSRHAMPQGTDIESCACARFPVVLDGSRQDAVRYAKSKGVITQTAFPDSIFEKKGLDAEAYPAAATLVLRCLLFPLYPMLKREEVEHIAKVLATLP
jgi:perosamine synthetase